MGFLIKENVRGCLMQDKWKLVDLQVKGDSRGGLVALESNSKEVPFQIQRVYYIFDTDKNAIRGKHAHHKLKQLLICLHGSCDFLLDDGINKTTVSLDHPDKALYIEGFVWREFFNFSSDCVIVVLASEHYQESDYIRNYNDFINEVQKQNENN